MANIFGIEVSGDTYDLEDSQARQDTQINAQDIDRIEGKIPSSASSSNKLATDEQIQQLLNALPKKLSGTVNFTALENSWGTIDVAFDTPLPNTDYQVTLDSGVSAYVHVQNAFQKTAGGFKIIYYNRDPVLNNTGVINWTVWY